jgi:hypothetical protein
MQFSTSSSYFVVPNIILSVAFSSTTSTSCLRFLFFRENIDPALKVLRKASSVKAALSRWLPTAAARVRARVWQVGFVVDKIASGQVFS